MKIAFSEPETQTAVSELLRPWSFQITTADQADVIFSRQKPSASSAKTVIIPENSQKFIQLFGSLTGKLKIEKNQKIAVPVNENLSLQFAPENHFLTESARLDAACFLGVDVVAEFNRVLNQTFDAKASLRYRLFTSLPIPYTKAPKRLRDLAMSNKASNPDLTYNDKLPLDALRFMVVNAVEQLTKQKMKFKSELPNKKTVFLITHDVDSQKGLNRASKVKQIEEKYDVASAWYVPSNHYPIDANVLKTLGNHGEIGSHDTKHDGKLAAMHGSKLTQRLKESKLTLEKTSSCPVNGFRAPLLQHTFGMLESLREAAFSYDSSVPTFEPNYPRTMSPHGIGTVFPIKVGDTLEIPLTIIQDHQLLYSLEMKPADAMVLWEKTASLIRNVGGCCVTLSHPEYLFFENENLKLYEDFLTQLTSDKDIEVKTPSQLATSEEKN
jgi:hypothetical protein